MLKGFNVNCFVFYVDYWIKESVTNKEIKADHWTKQDNNIFSKVRQNWGGAFFATKMNAKACNVLYMF